MNYEETLQAFQKYDDKIVIVVDEDPNQFSIYKKNLKIPKIVINKMIYIMLRNCQGLHCSGYSGWITDTSSGSIYINIRDISDIEIN